MQLVRLHKERRTSTPVSIYAAKPAVKMNNYLRIGKELFRIASKKNFANYRGESLFSS